MIEPGANNPPTFDTQRMAEIERNVFFHTLPPLARDRFLEALQLAESRGATPLESWEEAVVAAELAYTKERPPDAAGADEMDEDNL